MAEGVRTVQAKASDAGKGTRWLFGGYRDCLQWGKRRFRQGAVGCPVQFRLKPRWEASSLCRMFSHPKTGRAVRDVIQKSIHLVIRGQQWKIGAGGSRMDLTGTIKKAGQ